MVVQGYEHSDEFPMNQYGQEFLRMMNDFGVQMCNNDYLDNTFKHLYQQSHVDFQTNIIYHAKKRVRNFLKHVKATHSPVPRSCRPAQRKEHVKRNETAVNQTIGFLFYGKVEHDAELLREFEGMTRPYIDKPCGIQCFAKRLVQNASDFFFRLQRNEGEKQKRGAKNELTK